jgi:hypothetical protein
MISGSSNQLKGFTFPKISGVQLHGSKASSPQPREPASAPSINPVDHVAHRLLLNALPLFYQPQLYIGSSGLTLRETSKNTYQYWKSVRVPPSEITIKQMTFADVRFGGNCK